ncbi:MAG: hypothetical protein HYV38_00045 [Candidatus Levybacteria bacterium]|nr:hypothetical protein [Candidatus Levybacteria bacterium]MBI2420462.1 hypothetical protein [Candidatus Levybacteria bacterium]MBI4097545.1 hypothetical protein [Candidatus Levybacteria bacterium]
MNWAVFWVIVRFLAKILAWGLAFIGLVIGVLVIDGATVHWTQTFFRKLGEIWKDFRISQNWDNFWSWLSQQWDNFWSGLNLDIGAISTGIVLIVVSAGIITWLWRHRH